ncbi:CobW family GTP-binding protein [Pigmentiphaga sp.]|uniref:CobW family GTP-binding protein n=1 Tax=Pigmentiphaga sp. TaxID=1977564 RepID=UPI00128C3C46|nr:CobW family GTP-binding protein [Pigmentiphaga sp.]MPS30000.1 GTP-binding protein [Alcaligenaceae bacterium SAGV5]MPS52040.1 GTP-binding protein [Alcaligenaceae bacterium SAGV3]MPT60041.1 GTP-binding protein [Alcaligenaceae bacterium]
MNVSPIPLTVIGGFLGAGKSTLVNRLLAQAGDSRVTVLVNDFGAINIDAALIESRDGETISLANGCVCCSIGDDLVDALIRAMERQPAPDRIVIEASGVADPWRIAQVGLSDPALRLDSVVVLADAETVRAHAADRYLADTIRGQLRAGDYLILNKADLVTAESLAATRGWLAATCPDTPIFIASDADVPFVFLADAGLSAWPAGAMHACGCPAGRPCRHEQAHGELFESWSIELAGRFRADALRAWLRALPAGVLRTKGLVATDEWPWAVMHGVGRRGTLACAAPPISARSAIVAIGLRGQLPIAELDAFFRGARLAD